MASSNMLFPFPSSYSAFQRKRATARDQILKIWHCLERTIETIYRFSLKRRCIIVRPRCSYIYYLSFLFLFLLCFFFLPPPREITFLTGNIYDRNHFAHVSFILFFSLVTSNEDGKYLFFFFLSWQKKDTLPPFTIVHEELRLSIYERLDRNVVELNLKARTKGERINRDDNTTIIL